MTAVSFTHRALASFIGTAQAAPAQSEGSKKQSVVVPAAETTDPLVDLTAPKAAQKKEISTLNYYQPSDIGPLIAAEFASESRAIRLRTYAETIASSVAAVGGSLITSYFVGAGDSLAYGATAGAALLVGIGTWLLRRSQGQDEKAFAKEIGSINFGASTLLEAKKESLEISQNPKEPAYKRMIALRRMLTEAPLLYGEDRLLNASRALSRGEAQFPNSLLHVDTILEMMVAVTHKQARQPEIQLLHRNLAFVCDQKDFLTRSEQKILHPEVGERLHEVAEKLPNLAVTLFETRYADPLAQCSALNLSRSIIENNPARSEGERKILSALRENTIEVLLATIPLIEDPVAKAEQVAIALKIKGLDKGQKSIVRSLQQAPESPPHFTEEQASSRPLPVEHSPSQSKGRNAA